MIKHTILSYEIILMGGLARPPVVQWREGFVSLFQRMILMSKEYDHELYRAFKGIWIPKEIWLTDDLSTLEKVFLSEIDSLANND